LSFVLTSWFVYQEEDAAIDEKKHSHRFYAEICYDWVTMPYAHARISRAPHRELILVLIRQSRRNVTLAQTIGAKPGGDYASGVKLISSLQFLITPPQNRKGK
jgi:hypothetical protein